MKLDDVLVSALIAPPPYLFDELLKKLVVPLKISRILAAAYIAPPDFAELSEVSYTNESN